MRLVNSSDRVGVENEDGEGRRFFDDKWRELLEMVVGEMEIVGVERGVVVMVLDRGYLIVWKGERGDEIVGVGVEDMRDFGEVVVSRSE